MRPDPARSPRAARLHRTVVRGASSCQRMMGACSRSMPTAANPARASAITVVTDKVLIMGGSVIDNYSDRVPSGVIRGFDIYSGRLIWAFDAGNPDPNEMPP